MPNGKKKKWSGNSIEWDEDGKLYITDEARAQEVWDAKWTPGSTYYPLNIIRDKPNSPPNTPKQDIQCPC